MRRDRLAWWALASMLFDHLVVVFVPANSVLFAFLRLPGRFAMPAFAVASAQGAAHPAAGRYFRRLVLLAAASEYPYWLFFHEHISAVAALAVGVGTVLLRRRSGWAPALLALSAFAFVAVRVGAGFEAAYAALVLLLATPGVWARWAAYGVLPALNPPWWFYGLPTYIGLRWALSGPLPPGLPRLPRWVRYAFYPVHLVLLAGVAHGIAQWPE